MTQFYCINCSHAQMLDMAEPFPPCNQCGKTGWGLQPQPLSYGAYILCDWIDQSIFRSDEEFLKVQGIAP